MDILFVRNDGHFVRVIVMVSTWFNLEQKYIWVVAVVENLVNATKDDHHQEDRHNGNDVDHYHSFFLIRSKLFNKAFMFVHKFVIFVRKRSKVVSKIIKLFLVFVCDLSSTL